MEDLEKAQAFSKARV